MSGSSSKESLKKYGNIITDFANANSTDEACFSYFNNIQQLLDFPSNFREQVRKKFPSLNPLIKSLSKKEKKLLDLIIQEKDEIGSLNSQFELLGYIFKGCDPENNTLLLATYIQEGGIFEGEPDFTTTVDGPYPVPLDEIRDEIEKNLHPFVPSNIDDLMQLRREINKIKTEISENRFNELYDLLKQYQETSDLHKHIAKFQIDYKDILEMVVEGRKLHKISALEKFLEIYNSMQTNRLDFSDENVFINIPPITDGKYFRIKKISHWFFVLEKDLAYCMVEFFRSEENSKYLRKCRECTRFFIAKTKRPSTYCLDKCRLAYHNRERIKSGEAKKYKRKKRIEGAKESYYG